MSRVDFVRTLLSDPRRSRDSQIVGGLIQCLQMDEASDLVDRSFALAYNVRVGLSRRLVRDADDKSSAVRRSLLAELKPLLETLPSGKRSACGSLILELAAAEGGFIEDEAVRRFAQSTNGNLRKQALRHIRQKPTPARLTLLASLLQETRDVLVAVTLLKIGDRGTIESIFDILENVVSDQGYWLGRLYLLFGGASPADLSRLEAIDPISWLYVCAKLKRSVPHSTLLAIFADNFFEERSGLIVWCAGQLQAWDALVEMERLTLEPPQHLIDKHFGTIGLQASPYLTPPKRPIY